MSVNEGEAFVAGLDQATAKKLLAAAKKAGLDSSVVRARPGEGGFVVPAELVEKKEPAVSPANARKAKTSGGNRKPRGGRSTTDKE